MKGLSDVAQDEDFAILDNTAYSAPEEDVIGCVC